MDAAEQERRSTDAILLLVQTVHEDVLAVREAVQHVRNAVDSVEVELANHIAIEPKMLATLVQTLMDKAFPAGDPAGHCEAHEAQMQLVRDRAKFWKDLAFEVSKWGLLGVIGWLAFHAWVAFVKGPG